EGLGVGSWSQCMRGSERRLSLSLSSLVPRGERGGAAFANLAQPANNSRDSSSGVKSLPVSSACQRRFHTMEEQPGNQQADPDDESEKADQVNCRQAADPFLAQLPEIRGHPDGEEGEDKKQDPEHVRSRGGRLGGRHVR